MPANLSKDQADLSQFAAIYRARWAVEIQFREWKQALNFSKALNRKSNEDQLQALVLAGTAGGKGAGLLSPNSVAFGFVRDANGRPVRGGETRRIGKSGGKCEPG